MSLFDQLVTAIYNRQGIKDILKSDHLQKAFGMLFEVNDDDGTKEIHTLLTCAIRYYAIEAIKDILSTENQDALNNLLNMTLEIQLKGVPRYLSVSDYADITLKNLRKNADKNSKLIEKFVPLVVKIKATKEAFGRDDARSDISDSGSNSPSIIMLSDAEATSLDIQGSPIVGGGSGDDEEVSVKNYDNLTLEKLEYALAYAISEGRNDDVRGILNSKNPHIQEALMTIPVGNDNTYRTLLVHAIDHDNIKAAKFILETANHDTLKKLLETKSKILFKDGVKEILALNYAQAKKIRYTGQNKDEKTDNLIKAFESLIEKIKTKTEELRDGSTVEERAAGLRALPFYDQKLDQNDSQGSPSVVVGGSGNGEAGNIDKNVLFNDLVDAIKSNNCIVSILERDGIQDVLRDFKVNDDKGNTHTVLTYAIDCGNINAANTILAVNTASDEAVEAILIYLLMEELEVQDESGKAEKYMAFSYAEKKGNTELAQKIKQKMDDLGISIPGESAVNNAIKFQALHQLPNQRAKAQGVQQPSASRENNAIPHNHGKAGDSGNSSGRRNIIEAPKNVIKPDEAKVSGHSGKDGKPHTSLNGDNGSEKFPSSIANDIFFDVLKGDSKHANGLLNQYKEDPALFQSGWMQILLIGDEQARELAKKDNKNIIKEIQERQGVGICLIGGATLLVSGILTIALLNPIPIFIGVSIGLVMCIGGAYHKSQEVPDTAMDKIANEKHGKSQPLAAFPA
ncbi:hypothetical protein [Wolbachia endosymbiont of Folsomia candida]|uniref:hypothetical protein n=1 Tax=Wolbachia endosymbiont of Folsomia candida TaxID=169402 RepID=UPI000AC7AD08|nr:hypothetical protein [Wolbachia endosymbiont of Folsomia candida]APR98936.1 hypothetical protein ASM33_07035 [Wolbachia endosymbiont of Folsomia candida]